MNDVEQQMIKRLLGLTNTGGKKYTNYHEWNAEGTTDTHTFRTILDDGEPLFEEVWLHRWIKNFKKPESSIYPLSEIGEAICLGPGKCPLCATYNKMMKRAELLDKQGKEQDAVVLSKMAKGFKAKRWIIWKAITRIDTDGKPDVVEPYRLQSYYFNASFLQLITADRKAMSPRRWCKLHAAELEDMTKEERNEEYLFKCECNKPLPMDAEGGWDITITKSGKFKDEQGTVYSAKFEELTPLEDDDFAAIAKAKKEGKYPDINKICVLFSLEDLTKKIGECNVNIVGGEGCDPEEVEEQTEGIEQDQPEGIEEVTIGLQEAETLINEITAEAPVPDKLATVIDAEQDDVPF